MFPEDKIIEIFSICDDFSKVFDKTLEQNASFIFSPHTTDIMSAGDYIRDIQLIA